MSGLWPVWHLGWLEYQFILMDGFIIFKHLGRYFGFVGFKISNTAHIGSACQTARGCSIWLGDSATA